MRITLAEKKDLPEVIDLIFVCVKDMGLRGIHQWDEQYPTPDIFSKDIQDKTLYLAKEGKKIIATLVITDEQELEYIPVDWIVKKGKHLIVHRLAVHPKWQSKGIAKNLMEYAEEHARKNGYSSIRLDTYCKNPRGIGFYEGLGYKRTGEIFFPTHDLPFFCFEKVLDGE
ncbi:MAG: GNAT family N-acetyltransferase [Thermoplasmata archaeon]|nr:MAG: GNAT family N-acetyltransferase [Thermoplasmata archaeon]